MQTTAKLQERFQRAMDRPREQDGARGDKPNVRNTVALNQHAVPEQGKRSPARATDDASNQLREGVHLGPWGGPMKEPFLLSTADVRAPPSALAESPEDVTALLQRLCTAMYVSESSETSQPRVLLALDATLPGAAAEIAHEGAFLSVRLRARTDNAYRLMLSQHGTLSSSLASRSDRQVIVEIIRDQGADDGRPD